MKNMLAIAIIGVLVCITDGAFTQCKNMSKKCVPELTPYVYNGQLNSAVMDEGESAELSITFFAGQNYRLYTCAPKYMGNIAFSVYDSKKNMLFNNKDQKDTQTWDFKVGSTEDYIIQLSVPAPEKKLDNVGVRGCVALLVGFKPN